MPDAAESLLCRGMRDLLPDDMRRFRRIEQAFRDACRSWGYDEIRTPTLEHLYLFTSFGTLSPQLLDRVYSFLDWDGWTGERVVLRPDATIPVARVYRERLDHGPAKLAYVTNIFRFSAGDEPREVWQCGAELIGESRPFGDLELIAIALHCVRELGLGDVRLSLSHSGVVRALLEQAGFTPTEQLALYDRLLAGDEDVVRDVELRLPQIGAGLRLLTGVSNGTAAFIDNLRGALEAAVPGVAEPLQDLEVIARTLEGAGTALEVNVSDVRDFEYYTGPVFHVKAGERTVASGGRYDRLITNGAGQPLPACGFALYVDELMRLIGPQPERFRGEIAVTAAETSPACLAAAIGVAEQLQASGFSASLVHGGRRTRWRLNVAADKGQPRYLLEDAVDGVRLEASSVGPVVAAMLRG